MAAQRLSMRKIEEVLRLRALGQTGRVIAQSLDIGHSTVRRYRERAEEAGLGWPLPAELSESELEARLFPPSPSAKQARPLPEWKEVQDDLGRRRGVTLQLLWVEYKGAHPDDGYQYSQFCERYRQWRKKLDVTMRQLVVAPVKSNRLAMPPDGGGIGLVTAV